MEIDELELRNLVELILQDRMDDIMRDKLDAMLGTFVAKEDLEEAKEELQGMIEDHQIEPAEPIYTEPATPAPFTVNLEGGLDITLEPGYVRGPNSSTGVTQVSLGGGSAQTLANNTTNYVWLEIDISRVTYDSDKTYTWYLNTASIVVNTSATYDTTTNTGALPGSTTGKRVFKIAEVVTASGVITSVTPYCTGDLWVSFDETVSVLSTGEDLLPAGAYTNDIVYWDDGSEEWTVLTAPSTSGNYYLRVASGTLGWVAAGAC